MLALAFFRWWYGPGWGRGVNDLKRRLNHTYYGLSVPLLLRTLFSPWRRIITQGGQTLGDRLRAMVDNGLSRVIGLIVRLLTLVAAGLISLFWIALSLLQLILWPLLPLLAVGFIVKAVL